jgi:hypothetical protein
LNERGGITRWIVAAGVVALIGGGIGSSIATSGTPTTVTTTTVPGGNFPGTYYASFANGVPSATTFFPIAVWDQDPGGGNVPAPYTDQAQAFKAMGINTFIGISNWPSSFGKDDGSMAAAAANGEYIIAGGDPTSNTSPTSVASIQALLASDPSAAPYFLGYQFDDEPNCTLNLAAQVATIHAEGPGLVYANEGAWTSALPANDIGSAQCLAQAEANLRAVAIASSDDYAETDPWHSNVCIGPDCVWVYGAEARNLRSIAAPGEPVWEFIDSGTDFQGFSQQNGPCVQATNLCQKGNEEVATPVQVNAEAWDAIIGGAQGIEWFCDGSAPPLGVGADAGDACAGGGSGGNPVNGGQPALAANLTYVDNRIHRYAAELLSPTVSGLTASASLPMATMLKTVNGVSFVFAMSDRDGSTSATFTDPALAGKTARVVYDSAERYDHKAGEWGHTFAVSSTGSWSDTFGTAANPYQVKVYELS